MPTYRYLQAITVLHIARDTLLSQKGRSAKHRRQVTELECAIDILNQFHDGPNAEPTIGRTYG